ncbi:hypothetical protein D6D23_07858 [Aureobasidium pullulans]|uniref:F-box domain-containing protein n=1 Tax=Aureobasidium pullulans TaxID=5580 RepID=A0A4S8VLV9_AURPU|nr:hypothetical protein D6D24_06532 [Aureobasidium pullulans]THW18030.1 hypothetical protein D6D23_07858 [Aureobasidium pullulans]
MPASPLNEAALAVTNTDQAKSSSITMSSTKISNVSTMSSTKISNVPTMTPKPTSLYFKLPIEIFVMIALLCDAEDLASLRLVCKHFCVYTTEKFGQIRLSSLRHHLTKPSLEDLIAITAHHCFGSHVKSIELATARLNYVSRWRVFQEEDDEEDGEFRASGEHIDMLTKALENLKTHGNQDVALGVFDQCTTTSYSNDPDFEIINKGHGYKASYGSAILTSSDAYGTMQALAKATELSKFPFKHISIHLNPNSMTRRELIENNNSTMFELSSDSFKPDLVINMVMHDPYTVKGQIFAIRFETGSNAQVLIEGSSWSDYKSKPYSDSHLYSCVMSVGGVLQHNKFKHLTIQNMTFELRQLMSFLAIIHGQEFQYLKISHLTIWDGDMNPDGGDLGIHLLHQFKRRLSIVTLDISNLNLINGEAADMKGRRFARERITAQGVDKVQQAFADLMSIVQSWYHSCRAKTVKDENDPEDDEDVEDDAWLGH